jgi:hypothetical protein
MLGAAFVVAADVDVVADEMKKRIVPNKLSGAVDCVTIAQWFLLRDETEYPGAVPDDFRKSRLVAGAHYQSDFFDLCSQQLFDEDAEERFLDSVSVDEGLMRQFVLTFASDGHDSSGDLHASLLDVIVAG